MQSIVTSINVVKRNGSTEPLTVEKYDKVCFWACDGIKGVSSSELAIQAFTKLYDNITTKQIRETLIATAVDLICDATPNYDKVASRLVSFQIRKEAFGDYIIPKLLAVVMRNSKERLYTPELLEWFSMEEFDELEAIIDHDRDDHLCYAGIEQMRRKYILQDRSTGAIYETPQIRYLIVAAVLFGQEKENRMKYIKAYYDSLSHHRQSIPSPVCAGVGTITKQYSSCVLIPIGDDLNSINCAASSIVKYASKKAGIGIDIGRVRGLGARVSGGSVKTTGVIPYLKYMRGALKSCSQGGMRGASATAHFPWFHYEFSDLVVLKNNQGTEETRERHLDYCVQWNDYFFDVLVVDETREAHFFCPHDVPDLFDAFYSGNEEEFARLYELYGADETIRRNTLSNGLMTFNTYIKEFFGTGRVYSQFMTACINQGPFIAIDGVTEQLSSNLCQEVVLPVTPFTHMDDAEGMIALCTLSSQNWGIAHKPQELETACRLSIRALDNLLSYQEYPMVQAKTFTERYRSLGIGIIGLAHFLAKRDLRYGIESAAVVDEYMEAMAYYLTDESVKLAEERGPCTEYMKTCYGNGIFPWERRNKNIDKIVPHVTRFDWEELRGRMIKFGIRNGTLMALAPTETSSQLTGETNGGEPPLSTVTTKTSKDGPLKIVVPEIHRLKNKYDYRWDMINPRKYLVTMGVLQKWFDQGISVNLHYNPLHYDGGKIPTSEIMKDYQFGRMIGIKNYYYCNTFDEGGEDEEESVVEEPQLVEEEDCDACVI